MDRLVMIEALKLSESRIRAVRQDLEEQERKEMADMFKFKEALKK
jgi:hypothetical protein